MGFDPHNPVIQLCVQAMAMEENSKPAEVLNIFHQAWNEAKDDFEKYISAYFLARQQNTIQEKLKWLETSLEYGLRVNDLTVNSAFPSLYSNIANCYQELNDPENAKKYNDLAQSSKENPGDRGPFYHGTRADLETGDLLTPGINSNYQDNLTMNHIYFTAMVNGAGLAAALAKGDGPERVYLVEPTGSFENDPNVTDKKFPGNPTRSYRSKEPLKIVGEISDWARLTPAQIKEWKDKLANNKGEIIN